MIGSIRSWGIKESRAGCDNYYLGAGDTDILADLVVVEW